jgi:small subunit ribosomal protein S18
MADETTKPEGAAESTPAASTPAERPAHSDRPHSSGPRMGSGPRPGGDRGRPGSGPRPGGGGAREGGGGGGRKFFRRKKVCKFCTEKIDNINYKDVRLLSGFVAESGKIVPRRLTGVCTPHQRRVSDAIKQARNIALLPFAARQ